MLHRLARSLVELLRLVPDCSTLVVHSEELSGAPRRVWILVLLEDLVLNMVEL